MTASLERLWAGWRSAYVAGATSADDGEEGCVMCRVLRADRFVVYRGAHCAAVLNAYPYAAGHLLVVPARHLAELEDLDADEGAELWGTVGTAVRALKLAYRPQGINLGANLGRAAGAGVPGHLHVHVVPRWVGDTNFMTAVAEVRVLPESLPTSYDKLRAVWPA
ncbi:MAG: HIT domain-containing protein [Acidimicrobiales bacterium]